jgi:uncharacterized membrane protein
VPKKSWRRPPISGMDRPSHDRLAAMRRLRPIRVLRELHAGGRLALCSGLGVLVLLAGPAALPLPLRIALAWVAAVWLFLALTLVAVGDATPERLRRRAREQDERASVILALVVAAAGASLLALGFLLPKAEGASPFEAALRVTLAGLTVLGSWLLTHTMFTLHYAHGYYGGDGEVTPERGGLDFPGDDAPDYWDFLYFSLVVGMTCQVSDVQVTSRGMRRLVLVHGVVSFLFNTVILALAVNFLANAV